MCVDDNAPYCGDQKLQSFIGEKCESDTDCLKGEKCEKCLCKTNPVCGDGVFHTRVEECENDSQCDTGWVCGDSCVCKSSVSGCGDGKVSGKEECEPPGTSTCNAWCRLTTHGSAPNLGVIQESLGKTEQYDLAKSKKPKLKLISPEGELVQSADPAIKKDVGARQCVSELIKLHNGGSTIAEECTIIEFIVQSEKHTMEVNKVKKNSIDVTVTSKPQYFTIIENVPKTIDVTEDGVDDIKVTLWGVVGNKAKVNLKILRASVCGNGRVEEGEDCEPPGGRYCDSNCRYIGHRASPVCGNNLIERGEECDDGNLISGDGCEADCKSSTSQIAGTSLKAFFPTAPSTKPIRALPAQLQGQLQGQLPGMWPQQYAQVQQFITQPVSGDTGPAAIAVIAAGSAIGWAVSRRREKRK